MKENNKAYAELEYYKMECMEKYNEMGNLLKKLDDSPKSKDLKDQVNAFRDKNGIPRNIEQANNYLKTAENLIRQMNNIIEAK